MLDYFKKVRIVENKEINLEIIPFSIEDLKNELGEERFRHTQAVLEAAISLSEQLSIDLKKAKAAALLHDIAKNKTAAEMKALIADSDWQVDQLELSILPVLHAPAGAVIAEKKYKIKDREILEAIRFHTLGHPQMGKLAQLIYTADFIAEGRDFEGIDQLREAVKLDFKRGLYLIVSRVIEYQLKQDNFIHPYSNNLRNKLIKEK